MKKLALISIAASVMILTGCNQSNTSTNSVSKSVEVTGIRKASLDKDSQNLPEIQYTSQAPIPGKVKPFKKSYFTAPPMIPHSIAGMTPITVKNNMCLNCHLPQNAKALHVTPMPKDHFVDNFEGGKYVRRVAGSRYFCTTCHAPQAKLNPVVENKFESLKESAGIQ